MLHPIFSTVIQRPDLIAEHVSAYCAVIGQDVKAVRAQVVKRAVAGAFAVVFGSVFLVLSGMAVMLGLLQNQFHWALVAVPGFALVVTVIAATKAMQPFSQDNFSEFKEQVQADVNALRAVS